MSNCPHIYELQALADEQSSASERRRLSDHVARCARCAEALRELECARLPLHLLAEEPPAKLSERLLSAVEGVKPLAPLTCAQALEWASLRLDGELPHDRMQRLEAHLMACSACYRAAAEMQCATEVLRETAPATAPEGMLQRLQAAAELAAPPKRRRSHSSLPRFAMSFAAAAAAIVLAIALRAPAPVSQVPIVATAPDHPAAVAPAAPASEALRMAESPSRGRMAVAPHAAMPSERLSPRERVLPPAPATPASSKVAPLPAPPAPRVEPVTPSSPPLPAAPSAIEIEHPRPAAVALAGPEPAAPVRQPEPVRDVPAPPAPATVAALPRVTAPAPARVTPEAPKPAPAEVTVAVRPEPPARRTRSHWVSRSASNERDVYSSESGVSTRLADARSRLAQDARDVHNLRSPGYVILR